MKECNITGLKGNPGELYRPSNGCEGESFESHMCQQCKKENESMFEFCDIHTTALLYDKADKEYPGQWCYSENGNPCCTEFEGKLA